MEEKYEIRADCKSYSEWSVDYEGRLAFMEHEFEGSDIIAYKIIEIDTLNMVEDGFKSFSEAKEYLEKLTNK